MHTCDTQRQIIGQAHRRCAATGLRDDAAPPVPPAAAELAPILARNDGWLRQAAPLIDALYAQVDDGCHVVALADAGGVILHALGDAGRLEAPGRPAMLPGACWSERSLGANAIGTALARRGPVQVHGDEHYLRACRFLGGTAAPIFDADGGLLGALAVVEAPADGQGAHPHTLALVRMMVQAIETRLGGGRAQAPGAGPSRQRAQAPRVAAGLDALDTGDSQLALAIATVRKVLGRGIPIMIQGETGTGKELLAQAIHHDGPRASGPMVVVNCAAIPEALIESELFGYEEGAFTGARKRGAPGRIAQAHGGTLFLDEIGDMPLSLQARLLRVLQERSVTPLGGGRAVPVDIDLVCATHRSLRGMIADGSFREDLYYRLNGLVVKLPPLRERSDLREVVARMLAGLPGGAHCTVSADVMRLFERHGWPGNLRQLNSVLRTAVALATSDGAPAPVLALCHLSCDLLEGMAAPPQAAETPLLASPQAAPPPGAAGSLEEEALAAIQRSPARCGGNVSAAAKALGISRNTIYRKMAGTPAPA